MPSFTDIPTSNEMDGLHDLMNSLIGTAFGTSIGTVMGILLPLEHKERNALMGVGIILTTFVAARYNMNFVRGVSTGAGISWVVIFAGRFIYNLIFAK